MQLPGLAFSRSLWFRSILLLAVFGIGVVGFWIHRPDDPVRAVLFSAVIVLPYLAVEWYWQRQRR